MRNKRSPLTSNNDDLSYDDIQALVREGRRQRAVAVRQGLNASASTLRSATKRLNEKIGLLGSWLAGRTV